MSAAKWVRTGATLAAEATPVVTPPAASIVFGPVPRPPTGTESVWIALLDGTSITVQVWCEVRPGSWVKVGSPIALLVNESAQAVIPSGVPFFCQVTAAAGGPTTLATGTVSS